MVRTFEIPFSQLSQLQLKKTSEQQLPLFLHMTRIIISNPHEEREADYE